MNSSAEQSQPERLAGQFATTQWSLVVHAGNRQDLASAEALAALCQRYWFPLYGYVRRRVADLHAAQDLTQEFFARLLEKNVLAYASPERGRFRSFLLVAVKNFLANEGDKARAAKRGGGKHPLSLDFQVADSRLVFEPVDEATPEVLFEREWAVALLETVFVQLRAEHATREKAEQFEQLKRLIADREEGALADAAEKLGMTPGAAKVAAHRLRRRYRELLRAAIAETVADPADVNDEIQRLFATLGPSRKRNHY